ncbi:ubiquitin conjugating enzyme family protein [Coprinopsis cinerea okayama7|uniref:Ubiquitin conjugating enzyme family protein n=1 Tax=Coprinopsis cinerea (strain Okayama-7 / 130 / ATCC MYA-4618 / FGSC 9003) TaxID=240176 RepID=A8NXE7_COPC7|nr:ubiquitin conjugating enzyme family protein [Coprinopsis cinerea okayama7\|eukprot:XP_001837146.2 ubiquitin conjugating enzyme family protein [Coprinopsis cinerea okayama7\
MDAKISQLMDMAKAALKRYGDVMEAAEAIFEGRFDNLKDEDGDVEMPAAKSRESAKRKSTPSDDEDDEGEDGMDEDDDEDDYVDYDSDFGETIDKGNGAPDVDPYAGIFFSKDRREEVIEIEEVPETYTPPGSNESLKMLTQGQWMKGCPEKGEQGFLFGLYSQLSDPNFNCPHDCGGMIQRRKGDFFALHSDFTSYIERLRSIVRARCQRCHSEVCLACREPVSPEKEKAKSTTSANDPLFHCADLQGLILGVGLLMLEQLFQNKDESAVVDQGSRTSKRRRTDDGGDENIPGIIFPGVIGASGKKAKGGTGYAGDQKEDTSGQIEALNAQRLKDEKLGKFLSAIRVFLPNIHREGGGTASDYLVHPTALAHLRRRFNHVCSTLLRNDSLTDMSDRSVLYFELLNWLETISNHEALASMMAMPIMVVASVKSVNTKSSGQNKGTIRERTIIYEGSSSPRELLEGLAIQARAAIKGLEGSKPQEAPTDELTEEQKRMTVEAKDKEIAQTLVLSDESQKLLNFCNRILATVKAIDRSLREVKGDAFVDRLHASLPKIATTGSSETSKDYKIDSSTSDEVTRKIYTEWSTSARFEYCDLTIPSLGGSDDEPPHYKFYFDAEARILVNSDIPKRSLAIAKELAILTTNLPVAWDSSIFLRVDETRVDIIKALIIGPEGTPYQNGCFLFDIFLGPSYNQSPPNVKYMTTNGGKFRFNPNLYADGKVCLSLLGTWSGPGWIAGKSTLLQVLISIQSMILCEEPYLNEPGWANNGGSPQSKAYSANVRRMTVKTAMLGNLKNPPEPFGDIIRTHFRLKAKSVAAQLDDWLRLDDGRPTSGDGGQPSRLESAGSSNNGFAKDVEELKGMLKKLQVA